MSRDQNTHGPDRDDVPDRDDAPQLPERREALKQLGRAAYVPPTLITLLVSQKAFAASPIGDYPPPRH